MQMNDFIVLGIITVVVVAAFVIINILHGRKKKKLSSADLSARQEQLKTELAQLEEKQALVQKTANDEEYAARTKDVIKGAKKAYKKGGSELVIREVVLKDAIADSTYCVKRFISPDGINTVPLKYVVTDEAGISTYHATLYVEEMPKNSTFVDTFSSLFNYPDVIANVNIVPYGAAKSRKLLNKRIIALGSEQIEAEKTGDPNRIREINMKYAEADSWARAVEEGQTALYKVAIYLKVTAESAEKLLRKCNDLYNVARENGMELGSCYGGQAEALVSSAPLNRVFNPHLPGKFSGRLVRANGMKYHVMDKYALSTIYNHTQSSFSHKNGIVLGRNLISGKTIVWDPYNKSHHGFSVCVAGEIGSGKSATVKIFSSRYIDFDDCKVVVVDLDSQDHQQGEYAAMVKQLGGVVYKFSSDSSNRLNLFDINVSKEWDNTRRLEYIDLRLDEKLSDLSNIIMCIIKDGRKINNFSLETYIKKIVSKSLRKLYGDLGIVNKEPESLYTIGSVFENGVVTSGKVKKVMPILSDFYLLIAKAASENTDPYYEEPYHLILSSLSEWVDDLVYGTTSFRRFTFDEYLEMGLDDDGNVICEYDDGVEVVEHIHGIRPYFDGHSNLEYDDDVKALDLDISTLPEGDKLIAQEICCNYVNEHFIKRNSANPKKINKLLFIIDEFHRMLGTGNDGVYDSSRHFCADLYRTSRKKHVAMITITQSVADYDTCDEGRAIFKNSACKFILRQDNLDSSVLKRATNLTDAQIQRVLRLGSSGKLENELSERYSNNDDHKGEVCLIDNSNVVFLKVDYLRRVEAAIVETDAVARNTLYRKGMI